MTTTAQFLVSPPATLPYPADEIVELAVDAGYRELAETYAEEGNLYREFQESALARSEPQDEDPAAMIRLLGALSQS